MSPTKQSPSKQKKRLLNSSDEDEAPANSDKKRPRLDEKPSPKKMKLSPENSDEDDSDDDSATKDHVNLPPNVVLEHLEGILEYAHKHQTHATAKSLKLLIPKYLSSVNSSVDASELLAAVKKYLAASLKQGSISVDMVAMLVKEYLTSPRALPSFPDFPHKPQRAFFIYCKTKGIKPNPNGTMKELNERFNADEMGRLAAEREEKEARAEYLQQLNSFITNTPNLSQEQEEFVKKTVARMEKQARPPTEKKKTPGKPQKKEPMTAFDHFLSLNSEDYKDLEPEKRQRKMQKKFNKLPEAMREIYEKLAMRN